MKMRQNQTKSSGDIPLTEFPRIGARRAEIFAKNGADGTFGLLRCFPRAYENRGNVIPLASGVPGETAAFELTVSSKPDCSFSEKGKRILRFRAFDCSGSCTVVFFNQDYLKSVFSAGAVFRFWGKLKNGRYGAELVSPQFEPVRYGTELMPLVPVYPLCSGLTQKLVRDAELYALTAAAPEGAPQLLPEKVRLGRGLVSNAEAYRMIHRPNDFAEVEKAKQYFIYEELFTFAVGLTVAKTMRRSGAAPAFCDVSFDEFTSSLGFGLTGAQKRAIADIASDMSSEIPMARLVAGDVGCGKTLVAAAAAYICMKNGRTCALMAPTGILANQHYAGLAPLFEKFGFRTALLTGALTSAKKRELRERIAAGEFNMVIGTHALITPDVKLPSPGLVITDEQHRFGAAQRARLGGSGGGERPHVLVMSATPIPRTLAMILYGDLDVSLIDEMPPGRKKVDTFVVNESYLARLDSFILKNVSEGGQVYIVCPAVGQPDDAEEDLSESMKDASGYASALGERLPGVRIGLVHGRMKENEKDSVMNMFASGELDVLVSTTVIEVGVNVQNASLMIVENAERFGLSQLHQLRGRVGRGDRKSYCVLVSDSKGDAAVKRLSVMKNESDGYKIAEFDLEQRGPGDFIKAPDGQLRQHGMLRTNMMHLCGDMKTLEQAFEDAEEAVYKDRVLGAEGYENLSEKIEEMLGTGVIV